MRRELVPDGGTFGWDWAGVVANVERLREEMVAGGPAVPALKAALREFEQLESVGPVMTAMGGTG